MESTIPRRAFGCLVIVAIASFILASPHLARGAPFIRTMLLSAAIVLAGLALFALFIFGVWCLLGE